MKVKYSYGIFIAWIVIFCMGIVGCGNTKTQKGAAAGESKNKSTVKIPAPETRDVTLTWDEVPGATSYNIYWSDKPGVTKKNGTKISNVKNPHKIAELKMGEKYYFVVTAVNASGESKGSEEFSITVGQ